MSNSKAPFITKVTSNIKVGCMVDIGYKTLIVGPSGSGKSSIVNAIELALTGRAGDIAGRIDVGQEVAIMSLAPAGAVGVSAIVGFGDGQLAQYAVEGTTAKAKKASHSTPPGIVQADVLPVRSSREALLGSATTARKWLLSKMGAGMSLMDIRNLLPAGVQQSWDLVVKAQPGTMLPTDVLVAVLEAAGTSQRESSSAARTAGAMTASLAQGQIAPPSEEAIREAEMDRDNAREAVEHAAKVAGAQSLVESLTATLDQLNKEADDYLAPALTEARKGLSELPVPTAIPSIVATSVVVMEASIKDGTCYGCDGPAPTKELLAEVKMLIAQADKGGVQYRAAKKVLADLEVQASTKLRLIEETEVLIKRAQEDVGLVVDMDELRAVSTGADAALSELKSQRDAWATIQRSNSLVLEHEKASAAWKDLKDACSKALGLTLGTAITGFVKKVQASLPPTDVFDLKLNDGTREVVQFGLVRGDRLHTALSGAEWARVMAAISSAIVAEGDYACIIPEERAFDPVTLSSVLLALGASPHQVVMTSTVMPTALPTGWTVIQTGKTSDVNIKPAPSLLSRVHAANYQDNDVN